MFKNLVLKDLEQIVPKKFANYRHIHEGLKSLEERKNIVIRPADKGGGVVILEKTFYDNQLVGMLADENTYAKLKSDPTALFQKDLQKLIDLGASSKVLNKKETKFLVPSVCRIPTIYTLPKVHKDASNPPGWPIVNYIGSVTARLGQYPDTFLQASVVETKAYLKDTKNLLQIISGIDLSNKALDFCLTHNYFWYDQHFYSQRKGVAMGAKFAPSLANLFMGEFEDKVVFSQKREQLLLYKRYIDDLLFIWEGSECSLHIFMAELNLNNNNIVLEYE